jgi:lantibiotic modifying enzyme
MEKNRRNQIQQTKDNIEKHKKAIVYNFFDMMEELLIENLEFPIIDKDRIQAVITFENGQKVIYESDKLGFEQSFQKYLSWLNQNVFQNKKMYCKNILSYEDCSFVDYIDEQEGQQEWQQQDFYYRLGALMVVLASLNIDTRENVKIVKKGDQPVVKDFHGVKSKSPVYNMDHFMERLNRSEASELFLKDYEEWFRKGYLDTQNFMILHEKDIEQVVKMYF